MSLTTAPATTPSAPSSAPAPGLLRSGLSAFLAVAVAHAVVDGIGGGFGEFKFLAHLDLAKAGMVATISLFLGSILQPIFGIWADHGHQRRFVLWGTALCGAMFLLGPVGLAQERLGQFWTYSIILLLLLTVRIGQGLFHPAGSSLAGAASQTQRSTRVALFVAIGAIGFAWCQGLYHEVDHFTAGQTQWALLPFAAFMIVLTFWCKPAGAAPRRNINFRQIASALHSVRGPLLGLFLIQVLNSAIGAGFQFLAPEFTAQRGYSGTLINGGTFAAWVLGSAVMMVPLGLYADRTDRHRLLHWLSILSVLCYFAMILTPHIPTPLFVLLLAVAGGILGMINPLGVSMGQQLAPEHASVISGLLMGLAWGLSSFASWLVGKLVQSAGMTPAGALAVLGILLIPSCLCSLWLVRRQADFGARTNQEF